MSNVITIRDMEREGASVIVMLAGVSGAGKTYTAIQIAYGLANGNAKKVGFLDTESGRGRLYSDSVPAPIKYAELAAPFSPDRYVQAINAFAAAGVEVLVVDSASHEWEGIGGCEDIARGKNPMNPNWILGKAEHKRFMSALLAAPMHIVLCFRAREKIEVVKVNGKTEFNSVGLQPITEKNVLFEATVSLMIHDQGKRQEVIKCPEALKHIMGRGQGYITAEDGKKLRAWVDGAKQIDPQVEHARGLLKLAAERGTKALQEQWLALPKHHRDAIGRTCPDAYKASAKAFDEMAAAEAGMTASDNAALATLNAAAQQEQAAPQPQPEPQSDPAPQQAQPTTTNDDDEVF